MLIWLDFQYVASLNAVFLDSACAASRLLMVCRDLVKRGEVLEDGRLPPIPPVVLYNGKQRCPRCITYWS